MNTKCGLGDLVECLHGTCCTVYFDNFFTTVDLVSDLFDTRLWLVRVRRNRNKLPKDLPSNEKRSAANQFWLSVLVVTLRRQVLFKDRKVTVKKYLSTVQKLFMIIITTWALS
jgi:Transposase IS4